MGENYKRKRGRPKRTVRQNITADDLYVWGNERQPHDYSKLARALISLAQADTELAAEPETTGVVPTTDDDRSRSEEAA